MPGQLSETQLGRMQAYWDAANYLVVGQIYLQDNPLLREPLKSAHIKPRLLGHWGTSPGLNFIYLHLNRLIKDTDASVIYLAGPGHGGPALVGNVYLEGTYSEIFPEVTRIRFLNGYQRAVHALIHGRTGADRFHVRGFNEEGTTTTPFDMVVVNGMSRFHLCKEALRRARRSVPNAEELIRRCDAQLARHHDYVRQNLDDIPEIRDWVWTD
jgi:phosphoketolase